MVVTVYGDGSLYNDGSLYGRVGAALLAAQSSHVRQTHLQVQVLDEQLNQWAYLGGASVYPNDTIGNALYKPVSTSAKDVTLEAWAFRGGTSMCILGDGTIKRVRNGDPTSSSDRQVWVQTITDPTVAAQWASWSVLYSGTHYGTPVIQSDGTATGFSVIHCKSDGIYINNVIKWAGPANGDPIGFMTVNTEGSLSTVYRMGWVICIRPSLYDGQRVLDYYWTTDLNSVTPTFDVRNYAWKAPYMTGFMVNDGHNTIYRFSSDPLHFSARTSGRGATQWVCKWDPLHGGEVTEPYPIRGIGGGTGENHLIITGIYKLGSFYYLFGSEVHEDVHGDASTNFGRGLPIWMRSKDLIHWTDPVVGPNVKNAWGQSGIVQSGGYVYWASSEFVYRRPASPVAYDISNYVTEVEFNLPRANQKGSGNLTVANPNGINNAIAGLSDRELIVKPGLRLADGSVEVVQFDRFFITQCNRQVQGATNRLAMEFGNVWARLDTQLRDVTNFVGQIDWQDWSSGKRNKAFNYYFASAQSFTELSNNQLQTTGTCLYTGWKGNNPDITVSFGSVTSGKARVMLRYFDACNYLYVEFTLATGAVLLKEVFDSTVYDINSTTVSASSRSKIRVQLKWNFYKVWINDVLALNGSVLEWRAPQPGYVGFSVPSGSYRVGDFALKDWEAPMTSEDLVRTALAMGDYHDVIVGGATSRVFALIWGPQTDIQTQAEALTQALNMDKLQLIWKNGIIQVGKFTDETVVKSISNEIINSEEIDQAGRRINMAVVDGNEDSWMEVDGADSAERGRQIVSYSDIPELLDKDSVVARAREVINQSTQGASPGGTTPLFFDLWRMDAINWLDNFGVTKTVRIEGFSVKIDQGMHPVQHQTFDLSEYSTGSTDLVSPETELAI